MTFHAPPLVSGSKLCLVLAVALTLPLFSSSATAADLVLPADAVGSSSALGSAGFRIRSVQATANSGLGNNFGRALESLGERGPS